MTFASLPVINLPKPHLVFGSQGEQEYFAVSYESHLLGSMVHLHIRWVGSDAKPIDQRPIHTYLMADAPEWAREVIAEKREKKQKQRRKKCL